MLFLCLVLLSVHIANAQQKTITGKVTSSEDGSTVPGVSVAVKGTTLGTITNINGEYSLSVPADATTLVFSFVGMTSKEVEIGTLTNIDVSMVPGVFNVDEVVVTALGISREKKSLGYAVQDVKGDDITKAKETNVVNSLQGKVAGAQVTNSSGAVGASSRIVLRGVSSLKGDNQPLFIIDGVPLANTNFGSTDNDGTNRGSGVQDINPDDIESMSVLKGPQAAALYGSRASNGVIVIKTKSGAKSKGAGVDFVHSTTFENPLRLPDYQNEYGQGSGGKFSYVDGAGGGVNDGTDESWGPKLDVGLMIPQFFSAVDVNGVRASDPWVSHPDNVKNFFNTGRTSSTNVAFSKATEAASFRLSYTNMDQKGMLENTNYKKNTVSFSGSANLTNKLSVSSSGSYVHSGSDNMPGYGYDPDNVMQQFNWFGRQVDLSLLKDYKNPDGSWYNWNTNYHNNPYSTLYENLNTLSRDRFFGNVEANFKFTDWLNAKVASGMDNYSNWNTTRRAKKMQDYPNGFYSEQMDVFREINTSFLVTATHKVNNIGMTLNVGGNRMDRNWGFDYVSAPELAVADVYQVKNSLVTPILDNKSYQKRINSLYFSGNLDYNSMLFLEFTGRNDWASTLPEDNNSYFYPSVSLSADITKIMDIESDILSFAKIRGGYAEVGADTDPYQLYPSLSFGDGWNAGTKLLNQFLPNELPNAELQPERKKSFEIGTDIRLFSNKVSLDLTYYNSQAVNQILSSPISTSSGYFTKVINAGRIDNSGLEIQLLATPVEVGDFKWNFVINWSKNNNEIVELAEGIEQFEMATYWSMKLMAIPGEKFGSLYGYDFERTADGEIIYTNGLPSQGDLKILGNVTPDWVGGIYNEFTFKGLNFGFLVDGRKGGDIYSMTSTWGRYAGVLEETLIGREGGLVGDGVMSDGNGGYVPNTIVVSAEKYNKNAFSNDIGYSSVFDGSFIKLREAKLGYTFTNFEKFGIRDLNISLIGRNLAILWTKVPHIDPETSFSNSNVQGFEFGQLPSARSIGFSINFKL